MEIFLDPTDFEIWGVWCASIVDTVVPTSLGPFASFSSEFFSVSNLRQAGEKATGFTK